jgi:hypothetical protein
MSNKTDGNTNRNGRNGGYGEGSSERGGTTTVRPLPGAFSLVLTLSLVLAFTLPAFELGSNRIGGTFAGASTGASSGNPPASLVAQDNAARIELYAARQYQVKFNAQGGSSVKTKTLSAGQKVGALPTTLTLEAGGKKVAIGLPYRAGGFTSGGLYNTPWWK